MDHYEGLMYDATQLQTAINQQETEEEAERQDNIHLDYVTLFGEAKLAARNYLASREGEAPSVVNGEGIPEVSHDGNQSIASGGA